MYYNNKLPPIEESIYEDNSENENNEQEEFDNVEIDLSQYEVSEEDNQFGQYIDLLNIFNIYYKTIFKKTTTASLFEGIDLDDETSTNRALEMFYESMHQYKTSQDDRYVELYDPDEYKEKYMSKNKTLPEDYPLYSVTVNDTSVDKHEKITHNLITALVFISNHDWINCEWSINQLNNF
jgi:hypothetical protein